MACAAPILLVRGTDGSLYAFMNACSHRGAPVVRDVEGVARMLVCRDRIPTHLQVPDLLADYVEA